MSHVLSWTPCPELSRCESAEKMRTLVAAEGERAAIKATNSRISHCKLVKAIPLNLRDSPVLVYVCLMIMGTSPP